MGRHVLQNHHSGAACDKVLCAAKALQDLSASVSNDLESMKRTASLLPQFVQQTEGVGSRERKRLCEQVAAQASDLQHAENVSSRARAAAQAVLERVLVRLSSKALWLRVSFSAWRGVAERQALAACAQRTQDLEDWAARARDANSDRMSAWVARCSVRRRARSLRQTLHLWKCAARIKVRKFLLYPVCCYLPQS